MEKKWWWYIILYVGIAAILLTASVFASAWYFGQQASDSPTTPAPVSKKGKIVLKSSSQLGGVAKYEGDSGRTYYQVKGVFSSALTQEGEALVGKFVIDGDPNKTPRDVSIDARGGTVDMQLFSQHFEENVDVVEVPPATLQGKVKSGTPGLLLFAFAEDSELSAVLDALSRDATDWKLPQSFILEASTVGIIGMR